MQKILVIDDDDDLREMLVRALKQRAFQVFGAPDGEEGVRMARQHLPDMVISDVNMSKKDGYGVLAGLRGDPLTAGIAFIFMTGQGDKADVRRGMEHGADDYLVKPFTLSAMLAAVHAQLKKQQSIRAQAEKKLEDLRASLSLMLPHELNTPLVGILGYAELIAGNPGSFTVPELRDMGASITTAATRLRRLIQNFLLDARLRMGVTRPEELAAMRQQVTADGRDRVNQIAHRRALLAGRLGDLELEMADFTVAVSPEFFSKLVEELVDNAFKFSVKGQVVHVTARPSGEGMELVFSDKGRGMSPEQAASIAAYVQFERPVHEQQGSGMGLSLAKRLTELHAGRFLIQGALGQGTTVTVWLPKAGG